MTDTPSDALNEAAWASQGLAAEPSYDTFRRCWTSVNTLHRTLCDLWTEMNAFPDPYVDTWQLSHDTGFSVLDTLGTVLSPMTNALQAQSKRTRPYYSHYRKTTPRLYFHGPLAQCDQNNPMTARCMQITARMNALDSAMRSVGNHENIVKDFQRLETLVNTVKAEWGLLIQPDDAPTLKAYSKGSQGTVTQAAYPDQGNSFAGNSELGTTTHNTSLPLARWIEDSEASEGVAQQGIAPPIYDLEDGHEPPSLALERWATDFDPNYRY